MSGLISIVFHELFDNNSTFLTHIKTCNIYSVPEHRYNYIASIDDVYLCFDSYVQLVKVF